MLARSMVLPYFIGSYFSYKTSIEKEFIQGFANKGFQQNINEPTHKKGSTLDILLTTSLILIKI